MSTFIVVGLLIVLTGVARMVVAERRERARTEAEQATRRRVVAQR